MPAIRILSYLCLTFFCYACSFTKIQHKRDSTPELFLEGVVNTKCPERGYDDFTSNSNNYEKMTGYKTGKDLQGAMDGLHNGYDNIYRVSVNMV